MVWFNLKKLNFGYVECNGCTESMPVWVRDDRYMEYVALKRQFQWRDKNTKKKWKLKYVWRFSNWVKHFFFRWRTFIVKGMWCHSKVIKKQIWLTNIVGLNTEIVRIILIYLELGKTIYHPWRWIAWTPP